MNSRSDRSCFCEMSSVSDAGWPALVQVGACAPARATRRAARGIPGCSPPRRPSGRAPARRRPPPARRELAARELAHEAAAGRLGPLGDGLGQRLEALGILQQAPRHVARFVGCGDQDLAQDDVLGTVNSARSRRSRPPPRARPPGTSRWSPAPAARARPPAPSPVRPSPGEAPGRAPPGPGAAAPGTRSGGRAHVGRDGAALLLLHLLQVAVEVACVRTSWSLRRRITGSDAGLAWQAASRRRSSERRREGGIRQRPRVDL